MKSVQAGIPILIIGDFNARLGDLVNNSREEELGTLLDFLSLLNINTGSVPTFSREAGSIVDITAASETIAQRIINWRVISDVFNNSEYHYVQFTLDKTRYSVSGCCRQINRLGHYRWN